ncbi:MAG TPA: glycosyltransferase family 1 protein [Anaerolineae bacterium]|nr:glycosyltransferase family 1 protein [Anaerolineae bacterium]
MHIAIDYTAAARQGAGIGRYARELITAILAAETSHRYTLMAAVGGLGAAWDVEKSRLRQAAGATPLGFCDLPLTDDWMARLWQRARLPLPADLITGRADLFYSPDFVLPPLRRGTRAILTVHDLSFLRHPETFPPALRAYLTAGVPRSVAHSDLILADSEATRRDIVELLCIPPENVATLYPGVSPHFTPIAAPGEREKLQVQYGVGARPYILAVGTIQPRKNYPFLMEACDPLAQAHNLDLVIIGKAAWLADTTLIAAAARDYVHLLGFCHDADLPALYRQARLLAFPSLYEGFGFPPLEAMACGTPVVASTTSSVPEVVGDAGLLCNPYDTSAWTQAIAQLLTDESLRQQLQPAGLAQAARFTWEAAARRWLTLITPPRSSPNKPSGSFTEKKIPV